MVLSGELQAGPGSDKITSSCRLTIPVIGRRRRRERQDFFLRPTAQHPPTAITALYAGSMLLREGSPEYGGMLHGGTTDARTPPHSEGEGFRALRSGPRVRRGLAKPLQGGL